MQYNKKDINHSFVETTRPPVYTCMKYWGKKPHNIWREYIAHYVPQGGIFLDAFSGSGMSGIEAVKAGKQAVCVDINPLTTFVFDVMCSDFDKQEFKRNADKVLLEIENDGLYKQLFCYETNLILQNTKYRNGIPYEVCFVNASQKNSIQRTPQEIDTAANQLANYQNNIEPKPTRKFRDNQSAFTFAFKKKIGNEFWQLYTNKNLYVLSRLFSEIVKIKSQSVRLQLLYAFIQTVHLSSRMCVPRAAETKRSFSTSWGRSAFLIATTEMEMNPLLLFKNNCFGKQSVSTCLEYLKAYIGKKILGKDITNETQIDLNEKIDIWYGVKNAKDIKSFIKPNSISFVLTDPPYGGLVQYLDLSTVWLSWLEIFDKKYSPNYENEIIINDHKTTNDYQSDMASVLKSLHSVMKDDARLVLTFNNKNMTIWRSLLTSIENSDFEIKKVLHQQNMRSGESQVKDKYGTSSCDFYIRCQKRIKSSSKQTKNFEQFIVEKAKELILDRYEPTPYQILFNGLLAEISISHYDITHFDNDIKAILDSTIGKDFIVTKNELSLAGSLWWVNGIKYNVNDPKTLTNRVIKDINTLFVKRESITNEELLSMVYANYPNGLTPDHIVLDRLMNKVAAKKGKLWLKK